MDFPHRIRVYILVKTQNSSSARVWSRRWPFSPAHPSPAGGGLAALARGLLNLLLSYVHAGHVCHLSVTEPPLALLGGRTAPVLTHGPAASVCWGVRSPGVQAWGSGLSEGCLSLEIRCQLIPEREVQPERGLVFLNKSFLLLTCALDVRFL